MRYQINILKIIKGLNLNFFKGSKGQQDAYQQLDDKISFKHHRVKRTAQKMSTTKNLDALINLLDDFSEFIYLNDDEFARESMIMLFLVEKNITNYSGSCIDSRMAGRGSGIWCFRSKNLTVQYNKFMHAKGIHDSYGMHIDIGNQNVVYQYNYSAS